MTTLKNFLSAGKDAEQAQTEHTVNITSDVELRPSKSKFAKLLKFATRKNIIVVSLVVVIGVAVYLNWAFQSDYTLDATDALSGDTQTGAQGDKNLGDAMLVDANALGTDDSFFAISLVDRQRARDQAIETLQSVVYNAESMPDVKNSALAEISAIAQEVEVEAAIQTLIKGKGFEECIAVVSEGNANIIVKSTGLMPNEISQIKEIVYENAKILPDNCKIIEKS